MLELAKNDDFSVKLTEIQEKTKVHFTLDDKITENGFRLRIMIDYQFVQIILLHVEVRNCFLIFKLLANGINCG